MKPRCAAGAWLGLIGSLLAAESLADPWLAPGDDALRSDIELLTDAGILRGPVTTWPISWPDVARDVIAADGDQFDAATENALARVRRSARLASMKGPTGIGIRVGGATDPDRLRAFAAGPREEGELALRTAWLSEHFAASLQGSYVIDPDDGKEWRLDGSYLGVNFGNFMLSAGLMERWWGPGSQGSLILSTNARPIPSVTLERNYTDAFQTPLLSWLGPWRASIAMGELESGDEIISRVRFFATRAAFKPRSWLEVGLTRTAQWCGGDRPCGWDTFADMFLGNDNQASAAGASEDQPGNQMAGYDVRLRAPWRRLPLVVHTQWIGEDEAGGLPSKFLGQVGLETWGSFGEDHWRLRAEYADTTCNFTRQRPELGCAYRNSIYPQGYTYRGRPIGHAVDNDSRMYSLEAIATRARGDHVGLTIRRIELNRDGGPHVISTVPVTFDDVELRYTRGIGAGKISVGLGYQDPAAGMASSQRVHGFASWQQGF